MLIIETERWAIGIGFFVSLDSLEMNSWLTFENSMSAPFSMIEWMPLKPSLTVSSAAGFAAVSSPCEATPESACSISSDHAWLEALLTICREIGSLLHFTADQLMTFV